MSASTAVLFISRDDGQFTEPMSLMLLSALAKRERPHRSTHLALIERGNVESVVEKLLAVGSLVVVAVSAITGSHREYLECLTQLKARFGSKIVTIMGGPYCSTYPEAIKHNPCLDAIGIKECDEAWPEFLDALESGGVSAVQNIKNILTQENWRPLIVPIKAKGALSDYIGVTPNHIRNRFEDLDSLPYLDRDLLRGTKFDERPKRTHMASRGCPEACAYCFENQYNDGYRGKGKMLVRYSPRRFCEELKQLKETRDTRYIKFYDDMFPSITKADIHWLEEFAEVYPQMVGLPFHFLTRADYVKDCPEILDLAKKAGATSVTMSVESGNQFVRDFVIERNMQDNDMRVAFAYARKIGLATFANVILGIPAPTLPDVHDYYFQEKLTAIQKEIGHFRRSKGAKVLTELARLQNPTTSFENDTARRQAIVDYLRSIGVRATKLDYDKESVYYTTVVLGCSYVEYPILHPYPATEVTAYVLRHGFWDGDYDKLHGSYQNRSPFSCFSEYEKTVQQNFCFLAGILTLFTGSAHPVMTKIGSWLAPLFFERLAFATSSTLARWYQKPYTLIKQYIYETRIYPFKKTADEELEFLRQQLKLDRWKQLGEDGKGVYRSERPGATLGGPPAVH